MIELGENPFPTGNLPSSRSPGQLEGWEIVSWSELKPHIDVFEATGQVRTGLFVANNPINAIDPLGLDWQFSLGVGGTIGGNLWPFAPGPFVGGATNIGFTSSGRLFIQFQGSGMIGLGAFAGVGVQGGISHSDCPTHTGISWEDALHAEGNLGFGEAAGVSGDFSQNSQSISGPVPRVRGGLGYGAMVGVGVSRTTTIATPTVSQMYNGLINAGASLFQAAGF